MLTGVVSRVSTQRNAFGEVFLEVFIVAAEGEELQYFSRQRLIANMAVAHMLRPEGSKRKVKFAADSNRWLTAFEIA